MDEADEPAVASDVEAVLLDTDVFSNLLRGGERAVPWLPHVVGRYVLVSFVTAGELKAWAESRNWGEVRRDDLAMRLGSTVVVPYDSALIDEYGRVFADAKSNGHALAGHCHTNDRWIAATARVLVVPLLTGNRRHFAGLPGLSLADDSH
jgi:predicted nucleic acid-binding protein